MYDLRPPPKKGGPLAPLAPPGGPPLPAVITGVTSSIIRSSISITTCISATIASNKLITVSVVVIYNCSPLRTSERRLFHFFDDDDKMRESIFSSPSVDACTRKDASSDYTKLDCTPKTEFLSFFRWVTRLYMRVRRSVRRSDGPSVGP